MKNLIISYFSTLIALFAIDGLWLLVIANKFYKKYLGYLMADNPKMIAAVIFYLLYAFGISMLVILPALKGNFGLGKVFLTGALLGLIAYAAYDLTNQAIVKDWPIIVTVVDMAWGAFLTGTVATIAFYITKNI